MIGAAKAGTKIVAVGERGLVLLSDDNGKHWHQGRVPVSVSLTAVRFVNDTVGMAVGHGGVVLGTSDGGETWDLLLDGRQAADLALVAAKELGDKRTIWEAKRLVQEGPDKPFLDLLLQGPEHAIVVGAYGLAFETVDGGKSWKPIMDRMANPDMSHYYSIRQRGKRVVAVGERGLISISEDHGESWRQVAAPYKGSFFTVALPSDKSIVVAGLKGNIWRSTDNGASWEPLPTHIDSSITSSRLLSDGELMLANQAGMLLTLKDANLEPSMDKRFAPINAFVPAGKNLVVLTMDGIRLAAANL